MHYKKSNRIKMSLPSGLAICTKPTNHYLTEEKVKKSFNVLRVNMVPVVARTQDKTAKAHHLYATALDTKGHRHR